MKARKALVTTMGSLIDVGTALSRGQHPAAADVKGGSFTSELPVPKGATLESR